MADIIGTLVVVVLKAKDLPDKHTFSKQDPFATIALGGKTKQTGVEVKGGQHPVWDQELRLKILKDASPKNRTLEVACFAKEPRGDDLLGKGTLDITETLQTGEFDDWIKLENNGSQRGELYLEMTFYSSGPAPLQRRPTKMKADERLSRPQQPSSNTPLKAQSSHSSPNSQPAPSSTFNGMLAPPSQSSPPQPSPELPSLLRPGKPGGSSTPVPQTKPLQPSNPMDPYRSSSTQPASPPIGASAYPPSQGAIAAPLPSSLLNGSQQRPPGQRVPSSPPRQYLDPAGGKPAFPSTGSYFGGQTPSPYPPSPPLSSAAMSPPPAFAPDHRQRATSFSGFPGVPHPASTYPNGSTNAYPTAFPAPSLTPQPSNSPPYGSSPTIPLFPVAMPTASTPAPYPLYGTAGPAAPPAFQSTPPHTFSPAPPNTFSPAPPHTYSPAPPHAFSPAPYAPSHTPHISAPTSPTYVQHYAPHPPRMPASPAPYAPSYHAPPPPPSAASLPPTARLPLRDESQVATPRAETQPFHQTATTTSHIRPPAAAPSWPKPAHDSEAAVREMQRQEQEAERARRQAEKTDEEYARELDKLLNDPTATER